MVWGWGGSAGGVEIGKRGKKRPTNSTKMFETRVFNEGITYWTIEYERNVKRRLSSLFSPHPSPITMLVRKMC